MKRIIWWKNRRSAASAWSEQLSVGNAILDSEHRNLISKINNLLRMIEAGDAAALPEAFEQLETWLLVHFENERMFAQSINVDFEQHDLAHQRLLNELRHLKGESTANNRTWPGSKTKQHYKALHDWLIGHITESDMQMKPAFENCQYDYIPSGKNSMVIND
jgi:hemerythrin